MTQAAPSTAHTCLSPGEALRQLCRKRLDAGKVVQLQVQANAVTGSAGGARLLKGARQARRIPTGKAQSGAAFGQRQRCVQAQARARARDDIEIRHVDTDPEAWEIDEVTFCGRSRINVTANVHAWLLHNVHSYNLLASLRAGAWAYAPPGGRANQGPPRGGATRILGSGKPAVTLQACDTVQLLHGHLIGGKPFLLTAGNNRSRTGPVC